MISRRTFETAGFFTIAAALHVSAAALMLPEQLQSGAMAEAPPAALSAGGAEVAEMVAEWEAPPEIETAMDMPQPQPMPEPQIQPPMELAMEQPPIPDPVTPPSAPTPPDIAPQRPNLPEPPPQADPELALDSSARPRPRHRPEPPPEPQPRRQEPRQEPQREAPRQQAAAPQQAGQGGQAVAAPGGGGGGGVSAQQRANLMSQWGGQIRSCISRRASAPRGLRQGGRVVLNLTVARGGAIQGVGIAGSSGQPALDQAAVSAAQRAGRCPAAPAGLDQASYNFQLPINLDVR